MPPSKPLVNKWMNPTSRRNPSGTLMPAWHLAGVSVRMDEGGLQESLPNSLSPSFLNPGPGEAESLFHVDPRGPSPSLQHTRSLIQSPLVNWLFSGCSLPPSGFYPFLPWFVTQESDTCEQHHVDSLPFGCWVGPAHGKC